MGGGEGGAEGGGCVGEGGDGVGGQGRGEAGRVEDVVPAGGAVDDAEVLEVREHALLSWGEVVGGVGEAEFHGGDEEEEGEDVDFGHAFCFFGEVDVEEEQGPDLGVDVLEDESEAFLCDLGGVAAAC